MKRDLAERFEFVQPPDLPGVTVAFIENSCKTVRMVHETYTCSLIRRGGRAWECNGKRYRSTPGVVIAWQPGDVHACLEARPTSQWGMLIPPDLMHGIAREAGFEGDLDVNERQVRERALAAAHERLYRSLETPATRLERQTLFLDAVRRLLTSSFGLRAGRPRLRAESEAVGRAKAHLDEHFLRPIDLAELAGVAKLSRFHLLRTFKAELGCAPHAYQIDRKLARARELLARGAAPAAAALDVGFADQSHLTRHFKRFFGATPARWAGRA